MSENKAPATTKKTSSASTPKTKASARDFQSVQSCIDFIHQERYQTGETNVLDVWKRLEAEYAEKATEPTLIKPTKREKVLWLIVTFVTAFLAGAVGWRVTWWFGILLGAILTFLAFMNFAGRTSTNWQPRYDRYFRHTVDRVAAFMVTISVALWPGLSSEGAFALQAQDLYLPTSLLAAVLVAISAQGALFDNYLNEQKKKAYDAQRELNTLRATLPLLIRELEESLATRPQIPELESTPEQKCAARRFLQHLTHSFRKSQSSTTESE